MTEEIIHPKECLQKIIDEHCVYVLYFGVKIGDKIMYESIPKEIFSSLSRAEHRGKQVKLMKKLNYENIFFKIIKIYLSPKYSKNILYCQLNGKFISNDINLMRVPMYTLVYLDKLNNSINEQLIKWAHEHPEFSNLLLLNYVENNPNNLFSLCALKSINIIPYKYIRYNVQRVYAIIEYNLVRPAICEIFSDKKIAKKRIKKLKMLIFEKSFGCGNGCNKFYCLRYYFSMDTNIDILYDHSLLLTDNKDLLYEMYKLDCLCESCDHFSINGDTVKRCDPHLLILNKFNSKIDDLIAQSQKSDENL